MTLLLSSTWRNFRHFPSIWLNSTSHRALQWRHQLLYNVHTANPPNSACAVFVIVIMYLCTCRPWPPDRSATLSSCHCMVPPPSSGNRRQSPSGSHTPHYTPPAQVSIKKDGNRRQGKGRRVCLEGKICSIPCRTSCFASVDLKETAEFCLRSPLSQIK